MPCFNAYFEQEIIRNTQLNFKSVHKTGDIRDYAGNSKNRVIKEVRHTCIEMPKAAPKKSICHFHKLEKILK